MPDNTQMFSHLFTVLASLFQKYCPETYVLFLGIASLPLVLTSRKKQIYFLPNLTDYFIRSIVMLLGKFKILIFHMFFF